MIDEYCLKNVCFVSIVRSQYDAHSTVSERVKQLQRLDFPNSPNFDTIARNENRIADSHTGYLSPATGLHL